MAEKARTFDVKSPFVSLLIVPVFCATLVAADVTGLWTLEQDTDFGGNAPLTLDCTFKQDGNKLTGECGGASIIGEVHDQKVIFEVKTGLRNELTATYTADLDDKGTTMKGSWHLLDRDGKFEARKRGSK